MKDPGRKTGKPRQDSGRRTSPSPASPARRRARIEPRLALDDRTLLERLQARMAELDREQRTPLDVQLLQREFYARHAPVIAAVVRKKKPWRQPEGVEEDVQFAFYVAFSKLSTCKGHARAWMIRIALNHARDDIKKSKRERRLADESSPQRHEPRPHHAMLLREQRGLLRHAIQQYLLGRDDPPPRAGGLDWNEFDPADLLELFLDVREDPGAPARLINALLLTLEDYGSDPKLEELDLRQRAGRAVKDATEFFRNAGLAIDVSRPGLWGSLTEASLKGRTKRTRDHVRDYLRRHRLLH